MGSEMCIRDRLKLPIIEEDMEIGLDSDTHIETVVLLSQLKQKPDDYINVTIELDDMI